MKRILCSALLGGLLWTASGTESRFTDHGAPAPVSLARGSAATLDADGKRVLLVWQTDIRKLLAIGLDGNPTRQFELPDFPVPSGGGGSFGLLHSRGGRFYTQVGPWTTGLRPGTFYEFDPRTMQFTRTVRTANTYAMSFHEDRDGIIWLALYPNAQLLSYDPKTGKMTDHGELNHESWYQYPRSGIARDRNGWVYFIIGYTRSQILAYHPATGVKRALLPESERAQSRDNADSVGKVFCGEDGEVYGRTVTTRGWKDFRLFNGEAIELAAPPQVKALPDRAATGWKDFLDFPDGSKITRLEVPFKRLTLQEKDGSSRQVHFSYDAPGAKMGGVFNGPNGEIYGTTAYPRFVFRFDPQSGKFFLHPDTNAGGHWNAWVTRGNSLYGGFYPWGMIREIDTTRPWARGANAPQTKGDYGRALRSSPHIHRPNTLLLLNDGNRMILGGTPDYGHTGGGLTFFDAATGKSETVPDTRLLPHQSTIALANLPDGKVFGVTSITPGTGGKALAEAPEFYILDPETRRIVHHQVRPHVKGDISMIYDAVTGKDGMVYLLDGKSTQFYRFNPATRSIDRKFDLTRYGTVAPTPGSGILRLDTDGKLYMLFAKAILRFDPTTENVEKVTDIPVPGVYGSMALTPERIYFGAGSHLWSYRR